MHNWDYPQKDDMKKDDKWFLQWLLMYGFGGEKVDKDILKKYFREINIPENTRAFFELLLWNKPY